MIEHLYNRFGCLAPPAVRADDRRVPHLGFQQICKVGGINDLRVWAEEHGRRGDNHGGSINEREGEFADIGMGQVERLDRNAPGNEGIGKVLHHLLGAAMHGHVRDHYFVFYFIGDPFRVCIEDKVRVFMHRPMARGDQVYFESPDLFEVPPDTAAERHHDLGIIPLCRDIKVGTVGYEEVA